ncbi:MAG: DUF5685 family protein [Lachnospiraceae bacterium]|nr:DUF5685 family protein [Lachnospiraceae bacterium]
MFGYVTIEQPELKIREYETYRSYYCGLCHTLKTDHGRMGQLSLSYDMTFLVMLLTGLYEPETAYFTSRCITHPGSKHAFRTNSFSHYAADMNILLYYDKCMDDWADEKKLSRFLYARAIRRNYKKVVKRYPEKASVVQEKLKALSDAELKGETNLDYVSGLFGEIMAEMFVYRKDEWEDKLRRTGYYLGKFVYLADAYEDLPEDIKTGSYNPLKRMQGDPGFESYISHLLTLLMSECTRSFEILPILQDVEILRNILYMGVWHRVNLARAKAASVPADNASPQKETK